MVTSSALVGLSSTSSSGCTISARARAMRWRWPPENSCGYRQQARKVAFRQAHVGQGAAHAARRAPGRRHLGAWTRRPSPTIRRWSGARQRRGTGPGTPPAPRAAAVLVGGPACQGCPATPPARPPGRQQPSAAWASVDFAGARFADHAQRASAAMAKSAPCSATKAPLCETSHGCRAAASGTR